MAYTARTNDPDYDTVALATTHRRTQCPLARRVPGHAPPHVPRTTAPCERQERNRHYGDRSGVTWDRIADCHLCGNACAYISSCRVCGNVCAIIIISTHCFLQAARAGELTVACDL